jgi:hypothetical protein
MANNPRSENFSINSTNNVVFIADRQFRDIAINEPFGTDCDTNFALMERAPRCLLFQQKISSITYGS